MNFVVFAPNPWHDIWRNRQQIFSRLAARHRVLYIEPVRASLADYASLRSAYDMLRDSLGQEIAREELQVSMNGQIIQVALQTDVTFETGRAILSLRGEQTLRRAKSGIAEALQRLPGHIVRVEGHADSRPLSVEMYFEDYDRYALDFTNWELSTLRAVSAARFLQEELRLPAERLQVVGWSEYHPRATNRTAAGRAMNRRIDVIIAPIEEPSLLPKRPG